MTIPFAALFNKMRARLSPARGSGVMPSSRPPARVKKSTRERLSKTVLPNAVRSFAPAEPVRAAPGPAGTQVPPQSASSKVTTASGAARPGGLPRALALALEPKLERAVSLRLGDFIDQVPAEYIKPVEMIDINAHVSLKASEIEKGMPERKPTISLSSLCQQAPEIFLRSVPITDTTRVVLPYEKVLARFDNAHVRANQEPDPTVSQLETPILRATLEDTERFGTLEPLETSAATKSSQRPVISLHPANREQPAENDRTTPPRANPDPSSASGPIRIPFHFPPKGTGRPASERVPASSGPPVPSFPPSRTEPVRIPFHPPPGVVDPKISTQARSTTTPPATVALALKPILQNLPAFQLNGDATEVDGDVRVEFPCAMIEPQLASGRVVVPATTFYAALPEAHRQLFIVDPEETPVALPLQEVLKNLPSHALKIRPDQECARPTKDFETPFSLTAKEDSQRFQLSTPPVPETAANAAEKSEPEAKIGVALKVQPKEEIDAKEAVERVRALRGIDACAITFSDGLSLAGDLPPEVAAGGLCAMAPTLLRTIEKHMLETKLGSLVSMTLHSAKSAISFFIQGNIYLAALHSGKSLADETRAQLIEIMEKLSRTYAQPGAAHVDH